MYKTVCVSVIHILDACKVAGWGQTENPENQYPKTLFETNMTYVDTPACAQGT